MFIQTVTVFVLLLLTRICVVLFNPSSKPRQRKDGEKCVLAVFLGSGFFDNPLVCAAFSSSAYGNPRWAYQRSTDVDIWLGLLPLFTTDLYR